MKRLLLVLAFVVGVDSGFAQERTEPHPRDRAPVTFLQINDVYSTVPIEGIGGLARVATLKRQLTDSGHRVVMVLAGDFLSPSVASSFFRGQQMVDTLNAAGLDLATLGNHEFDFGDDVLIERMRQSKFRYVISNVVDTNTGHPIGGAAPYLLETYGTLKVGYIGLVLTTTEISADKLKHTRLSDPFASATRYIPVLKRAGAQVIVAITHLTFADDRKLAQQFPDIDLIIGGHEHFPITSTENRTLISKAGSDARWVARIDVNQGERFFDLEPVTAAIPDDAATAAVADRYEQQVSKELDVPIAASNVALDASAQKMRSSETNLGDLVADAMRADTGADVALMNSGSIRGDRVYPAGPITGRTLLAMHPFGNTICTIDLPGRVLLQALNSGVSKLPNASGGFPQVSGLTMVVDVKAPPGARVQDVRINDQPLDLEKHYTLAIPDFVLKGGDAYSMFAGQTVIVDPETGPLLVQALGRYVIAKKTVDQAVDGRITIR
jgi:5'-nucleotidase